jgi:ketosteroid isomerase-like protein
MGVAKRRAGVGVKLRLAPPMNIRRLLPVILIVSGVLVYAQTPERTLAENKAIVLRSESELWSKGNLAAADELYSPNFVCHFVVGPEWKGVQGIKREVASHRTSFPDWQETVDDVVAEGDKVVIRFTSTGTHRGEFQGMAPTGRKVKIQEMATSAYRMAKLSSSGGCRIFTV